MNMQLQTQLKATSRPTLSFTPVRSGVLQCKRACGQHTTNQHGECTECRKKRLALQRRAVDQSGPDIAPPIVHEVLRSAGRPLDPATRAFMEPRFGHDFSQVRVHTDGKAADSARAVNALAYTVGQNVVLSDGQQAVTSTAGRRLMAHELAHVVQQQGVAESSIMTGLQIAPRADGAEQEAAAVTAAILANPSRQPVALNRTGAQISRETDPTAKRPLVEQRPQQRIGSTLPYREATELARCIQIMGDANADYCRQTVLGEPPPSSLSVNPDEVQPRATCGIDTSTVTVTGATPGARIRPTVTAVVNSGGHQHHAGRPVGTIRPVSRVADASGRADFTYRSNLSGGVETIRANVAGGVRADIEVRVPGLVEMLPGADYDLVGQTATHPDNHFGTAATVMSLQRIAANYEAHKVANNQPNWPRVAYNDISLERGGIFDIYGNWAPPHRTHRVGQTVDFRTNHLNAAQRAMLSGIIQAEGGAILNEGDHWHLTF